MTRFPNTRMALARIFSYLTIIAIPPEEEGCTDVAFSLADLLKHRAYSIKHGGGAK